MLNELRPFLSMKFAMWLAAFLLSFVALSLALGSLGANIPASLCVGAWLGQISTITLDWIEEKYLGKEKPENVA